MQLVYKPKPGFSAPGNSWPTSNHEEKNAKVAQAKLDSGFYREKGKRVSKPAEPTPPKSTKQDTRRGSAKKGDA